MAETTTDTTAPEIVAPEPSYAVLEASLREAHEAVQQLQATNAELLAALRGALAAGGTLARVR